MIALISGASREVGLAFAVARNLIRCSFEVVLTSRDVKKAKELARRPRDEGGVATALQLDVTGHGRPL